jgi:acetyl-CoA carboxylase biotin carboxylase subunit
MDYDPLLAKLIGYGSDRAQVIARLERALDEYFVGGIKANVNLFRRILGEADFQAGRLDTSFLDRMLAKRNGTSADAAKDGDARIAAIAAGLFAALEPAAAANGTSAPNGKKSAWKEAGRPTR